MEEVLNQLVALWLSMPWDAIGGWPWWQELAIGVGGTALVGSTGYALGARRRTSLEASNDVLAAMERVVRDDLAGAFQILSSAAKQPDAPPEVYLALASLLRSMGHPDRSSQVHRAVLQRPHLKAVTATRATLGLASDLLVLGRADDAETILKRLPRKVRRQPALLALRRKAAMRSGDWKEALAAGQLIARYEHNKAGVAEVYCQMASAALGRGDDGEAAVQYRRALRKDGENIEAREGLARIYVAHRKFFRAKRLIVRGIESIPDVAPRLLPLYRVAIGSRERYLRQLEEWASHRLASPWVELEVAELLYSEDDVGGALELLQHLVRDFPRSIDVREAYLNVLIAAADDRTIFNEVDAFMQLAGELVSRFECGSCGHGSPASFVRCASCGAVGTVEYRV